jgi:osmoprotectant transport system substrate-binding protein
MVGWPKAASALLAALAVALSAGACGASNNGDVTIAIGSRGTPEEEILGHIYTQALRAAGYQVNGDFGIDTEYRDAPLKELKSNNISGYPDHVDAVLGLFFNIQDEDLPNNPQEAYRKAKSQLEKEGLTAFPPTPYSLSRSVGLLRTTAEERHLRTVSDLRGQAEEMTLSGFTDCHFRLDCLAGIEKYYGIYFEAISYMYTRSQIHRRYKILENGEIDASILYSTDGRLAAEKSKFVTLEDDKHVFPAGNAIFVTSAKVDDEAGPDLEETIVAAQKGLTLPVMQQLDAEVELERKKPAKVAAGYLKRVRLAG